MLFLAPEEVLLPQAVKQETLMTVFFHSKRKSSLRLLDHAGVFELCSADQEGSKKDVVEVRKILLKHLLSQQG